MALTYAVVIPSAGRIEYLREALSSVHNQTLKADICVVVMDAPRVLFEELIALYCNTVTFIKAEKSGGNACRYQGARLAISEKGVTAIAFLDDDDYWMADKIEIQANRISILLRSSWIVGSLYAVRKGALVEPVFRRVGDANEKYAQIDNPFGTFSNMMISADLVSRIDTDVVACQDWHFLLASIHSGAALCMVDAVLMHYRVHHGVRMTKDLGIRLAGFSKVSVDCMLMMEPWAYLFLRGRVLLVRGIGSSVGIKILRVLASPVFCLVPGPLIGVRLRLWSVAVAELLFGHRGMEALRTHGKRFFGILRFTLSR